MGVLPGLSSGSIMVVRMVGGPDIIKLGDSWGGEGLGEWLRGLMFWSGLGGQASGFSFWELGPGRASRGLMPWGDFWCAQSYALSCFLFYLHDIVILKPLFSGIF